jgi:putative redox protein
MPETKLVELEWQGAMRFRGGEPGGPTVPIDGDNAEAPGPMLALLIAAGGCTGADIVSILQKMRIDLQEFRVELAGIRRDEMPRRYTGIHFRFRAKGVGLDDAKLQRAVELSLDKYCSVVHSLAPDIRISYDIQLL